MPYYITKKHPDCKSGWATVNGDYQIKGCHKTKAEAIKQMVAISIGEDVAPGGTHPRDKKKESATPFKARDILWGTKQDDE